MESIRKTFLYVYIDSAEPIINYLHWCFGFTRGSPCSDVVLCTATLAATWSIAQLSYSLLVYSKLALYSFMVVVTAYEYHYYCLLCGTHKRLY